MAQQSIAEECPSTGQSGQVSAAGRLLAVLDAFGPTHPVLTLSEISRRAGLSLSTAHRLVRDLSNWGALERDASGRYALGLRLLELAALAPRGLSFREAAYPVLDKLAHRTQGNVHLGVRDDAEVVYIEALRATATHPTNSRIGDRWPMHATGTGLVLLAYADAELQERILRGSLQRFTPMTVTDPRELRRQLCLVRQSGVAIARGQITLPDLVVAAPVYDQAGAMAAAISVVVEAQGARPKLLARMLVEAAAAITRGLGQLPAAAPSGPQRTRHALAPAPRA